MTWSDPGFEAVAELLARRTGLAFGPTRQMSAEAGVRRAMRRAGVADLERYAERLAGDPAALDDLVVELTVGETYFFRQPEHFDFVRREVLPDLWRRHGPDAAVRAWSAGCASGEEAYSLAIVLTEAAAGPRTHLLATDISRAALAKARRAVFGAWSLRGEGAAAARPYLIPLTPTPLPPGERGRGEGGEGRFVLNDAVRRRVHIEYLNLALDVYPSLATDAWGMHVIFCRNVLIYFNAETIEAVARRLYDSLAPGGWLFTAASDPPLAPHAPFETVTTEAGILYRRPGVVAGERSPAPPLRPLESAPLPVLAAPYPVPSPPVPVLVPAPVPAPAVDPVAEALRAFAEGDYQRAADLTAARPDDAAACVLHVRTLANLDADRAERACAKAANRHRLSAELHYLHGVLLVSLGRDDAAAQALRRVLYLDRSLAAAHFTLGSVLERCGDAAGARRAYRNARDLCRALPADEAAPLADGEPAGRLAEAAANQLAVLDAEEESP